MAPNYPEEVDVFTVPHSRMKQLVHTYLDLVSSTSFRDVGYMTSVLEKLCHTFHVFKAHEQIENRFIMRRLKEKLTALDITDAAVCNCHSDNRLTEMMSMVLDGYRWAQRGESERIKYGLRLRRALEDFTQVFIPHMKEEEEVFQPMLVEYFTYDELKELKAKVIQQHLQKVEEATGHEKYVPECDSDKEEEEEEVEMSPAEQLPTELMVKILSYLSPKDLCRCAQVSQHLNQVAMDPSLWRNIHPVQWAAGDWRFQPHQKDEEEEEERMLACREEDDYYYLHDEDADRDESSDSESSDNQEDDTLHRALREVRVVNGLVRHVLPRVGAGVEKVNLSLSRGISSSLVHKILKLCPNLKVLDLAHTKITDTAFKEYGLKGSSCKLEYLDLGGCENISDSTLRSLAGNQHTAEESHHVTPVPCKEKGSHSMPSTLVELSVTDHDYIPPISDPTLVELSVTDHDYIPPISDPVIVVADPSFTDLPLELCHLDCMDVGVSSPSSPSEDPSGVSTDIFSCCSVKRTCCSSENKDFKTDCCGGEGSAPRSPKEVNGEEQPHALHRLTHLSLNGCYRITNEGLRALSERGGLPQLKYLDLSGCFSLTGEGVAQLVDTCHFLDHASLFYCDNVYPDPFPTTASGCRNLECGTRFCCRSGH